MVSIAGISSPSRLVVALYLSKRHATTVLPIFTSTYNLYDGNYQRNKGKYFPLPLLIFLIGHPLRQFRNTTFKVIITEIKKTTYWY